MSPFHHDFSQGVDRSRICMLLVVITLIPRNRTEVHGLEFRARSWCTRLSGAPVFNTRNFKSKFARTTHLCVNDHGSAMLERPFKIVNSTLVEPDLKSSGCY